MLTEILGCLNIRVAGGKREKWLYGLLLIFSGGSFTYAAFGILPTYRESRLSVTYYDSMNDEDWILQHARFPDIRMSLNPDYDQAKVKPLPDTGCSGWEVNIYRPHWKLDAGPSGYLCVPPEDIVCGDDGPFPCHQNQVLKVWKPGRFDSFILPFETSHNFPVSSDMKWQRNNELFFGGMNGMAVQFPAIAHDIYITIDMIGLRQYIFSAETLYWEYRAAVNAVPVYNPAYEMPNETHTTITVQVSKKIEVQEYLEKSAWQVWAELGGAWGGAMLIIGVCFAQKGVRGKNNTSPNTEVQVCRLRNIKDRRALLQELAAMLQDAEEASEANGGPCQADVVGKVAESV